MRLIALLASICLAGIVQAAEAQSTGAASTDFQQYAMRLREEAILKLEPVVVAPTVNWSGFNRYQWKRNITTTVFWVGELPTPNNPVPNIKSAWDMNWLYNYGGYDTPDTGQRHDFVPRRFVPRQNPFYVALPYNDVMSGSTKAEAAKVIPWFKQAFERPGKSVCKGRWLAIRHGNRVAYAQWEDVGPFRTDHWQYVFGSAKPMPNLNRGAGLDVSPAVRDYLGLNGMDVCDWKFVDASYVPGGPWKKYGDNNTFVLQSRGANLFLADRNNAYTVSHHGN